MNEGDIRRGRRPARERVVKVEDGADRPHVRGADRPAGPEASGHNPVTGLKIYWKPPYFLMKTPAPTNNDNLKVAYGREGITGWTFFEFFNFHFYFHFYAKNGEGIFFKSVLNHQKCDISKFYLFS
jgi:hypothetical protein